ncbi:MAG: YqjK-like family protein [Betaproteobacteria bacterium]|nr:YqjK-like family protein [Betaproteobacteria bacterium]
MNNKRLLELARRRGQLEERIVAQRMRLAETSLPLQQVAAYADRVVGAARSGLSCLRRYPLLAGLAVGAVFATKPRRIVRWARRGWMTWQLYRSARRWLYNTKLEFPFQTRN